MQTEEHDTQQARLPEPVSSQTYSICAPCRQSFVDNEARDSRKQAEIVQLVKQHAITQLSASVRWLVGHKDWRAPDCRTPWLCKGRTLSKQAACRTASVSGCARRRLPLCRRLPLWLPSLILNVVVGSRQITAVAWAHMANH